MQFKVTTFNLRYNTPKDQKNAWPNRVDSVIQYINVTKPHIIGTQEILDNMLNDLDKNLTNYSHIGLTRKQGQEASVIFYNHDILEVKESGTFWLSRTPEIPNSRDYDSFCVRVCTWAEFMVKNNRLIRFRVFNTHLDHISNLAKIEGLKIILKKMKTKNREEKLPSMLMGDFNSTIKDKVIQSLKEEKSLVDVMQFIKKENYGATFHNFTGKTQGNPIDHIYVTNDINVLETSIFKEKINQIYPSDHYPVSVMIDIKEPFLNNSFNTHNERCCHAEETIQDYVFEARRLGFKSIGFTNHMPYKNGRLPVLRMDYDLIDEYLEEIDEARNSFNDIEIYSGFECEYFKDIYFDYEQLKQKVDYLILVQHFIDVDGKYVSYPNLTSKKLLYHYVEQIEEALDTHLFSILAHPDLYCFSYPIFDNTAIEVTHRIAKSAMKNNVTLELNANGFREKNTTENKYPYPSEAFWKIIACDYPHIPVIITPNALRTEFLNDEAVEKVTSFAKKLNLNIVGQLTK